MRRRIAIFLGLLLTMVVLGDAATVIAINKSIGVLKTLVDAHRIQNMREHLAAAGQRVRADQLAALAGLPADDLTRNESQTQLRSSVSRCNACHHVESVEAELNEIAATMETYLSRLNDPAPRSQQTAVDGNVSEVLELGRGFVDRITKTADRASKHLIVRSDEAMQSVIRARLLLFVALGAALVLGLASALHLQRRLTRPVRSIINGITRLRSGEQEYRLALTGDLEFREMAQAFNDAYAELQGSQEAVVNAERLAAVGHLAAGVAHEVLNPMASISSAVEVLRHHSDDPEYVARVSLIMKEIDRVTKIVRDLHAFSRTDETDAPINIDLHAAIDHAINLVSYDKRSKRAKTTQNLTAEDATVRGQVDRLLTVLTNVLFNALDAASESSAGCGEIGISTSIEGNIVVLCVYDNGPGMTSEQIARAFEPFFTTKPPGFGTGLGLWTTHRIVQNLGGSMSIESAVGAGTTLTIRLPQCKAYHDPISTA